MDIIKKILQRVEFKLVGRKKKRERSDEKFFLFLFFAFVFSPFLTSHQMLINSSCVSGNNELVQLEEDEENEN